MRRFGSARCPKCEARMPIRQMAAHEARHCPARAEMRPLEELTGRMVACSRAGCAAQFQRSRFNKRQRFCSAACGISDRNARARERADRRRDELGRKALARNPVHTKNGARGALTQEHRNALEMEPLEEQDDAMRAAAEALGCRQLMGEALYLITMNLMEVAV